MPPAPPVGFPQINWSHPLNRGLKVWLLAHPRTRGANVWRNLVPGVPHGVITGGTTWRGSSIGGSNGTSRKPYRGWGALSLDGSANYVELGSVPDLDGWTSFTVSLWIKRTSSQTNFARLVEKGVNVDWCLRTNNLGETFLQVAGAGTTVSFSGGLDDGSPHLIMASGEYGTVQRAEIWVDGASKATTTTVGTPASLVGSLRIGDHPGGGNATAGYFDDIRIYKNRYFTKAEARDLYVASTTGQRGLLVNRPRARISDASAGGGAGALLLRLQTEGLFVGQGVV